MPIRALVADDEPGMRLLLVRMLEKVPEFMLCGEAADGQQALEMFEALRPDVLFLDVEMPKMSGIEVARQVQDIAPDTVIVFITAHEQYRKDAYEVYAMDYLVKPFDNARMRKTLERIIQWKRRDAPAAVQVQPASLAASQAGRQLEKILIKGKESAVLLDLSDIVLIQREERQSVLYTRDGERIAASGTLTEIEERLPNEKFFRAHRSYIINLDYVSQIYPYGRWTYVVRLKGISQDALLTRERYDVLESMLH
ncbi:MAG: LytR/AlgR family response regulator transcription factor [Christensenellales bacterium]|jgi:two-component system LytT family response regulator